jgi:hypothetical protein
VLYKNCRRSNLMRGEEVRSSENMDMLNAKFKNRDNGIRNNV